MRGRNAGTDGKFSHVSLRTNQKLQEPFRLSPSIKYRGPDSREGRFTLVTPGVGASTRNQWTR